MDITLPPELEHYISEKVASGLYPTATEVIRDGVGLLRERDELQKKKLQALRQEVAIGLKDAEEGRVQEFSEELVEQIKVRGRQQRLKRVESASP